MPKEYIIALACVFFRLAPITIIAPVLFLTHIPLIVRTISTIVIACVVAFCMDPSQLVLLDKELKVPILLNEFLIGMVLSLSFHAVSAGLHMMAQLIDIQMGLSAGATFDPANYQTNGVTGRLFSLLAVAIFFGTGLHYEFLYALGEIFQAIPPGQEITLTKAYFLGICKLFVMCFILAGPVIIVMFLTDVTLALISRSMPQAQIYFVALPLKIMIGILMLALTISLSQSYFYELLEGALSTWNKVTIL